MYLKYGDKGATVRKMQFSLQILGCTPNGFDGEFGPGMKGAVERFQRYYGMTVNGIITDNVVTKIVNELQPIRVQLKRKGFYNRAINKRPGDLVLYEAVRSFQKSVGLATDGSVGPATRVRLFSTSNNHEIVSTNKLPLGLGSTGDLVLYLQYGLHILDCQPGMIDGSFGNNVLAAVKRFQKKYGLSVDGSVGIETWNKMKVLITVIQQALVKAGYALSVINGIGGPETYQQICSFQKALSLAVDGAVGPSTRPILMGTESDGTSSGLPLILGSTGDYVECFQYGLHICGINPNGFDGSFGYGMQNAVKTFQKNYGLTVDGSVGTATWNKMLERIRPIQQALATRGYYASDVNGVPGVLTYNGLKNFQKAKNLAADGMAGPATKEALGLTSSGGGSGSTGTGTVASVLTYGSNGSLVRYLQRMLRTVGYAVDIDGSFGPAMQDAVKKFQSDNRLSVDGSFGPASWKRMFEIYKIPSSAFIGAQNMAEKIACAAEYELALGFREDNNNDITPYGEWYGMNGQPWCAMFVSWCALQAGTLGKLVPKFAYCPSGKNHYSSKLRYRARTSGYKPKRGDIVFFWDGRAISHTGIVVSRSGNTVMTIEGNASRMVKKNSYNLNNTYIDGYGITNMPPTPGDPDYTPDRPDNPDQVPADTAENMRNNMALRIIDTFTNIFSSENFEDLPIEEKNQLTFDEKHIVHIWELGLVRIEYEFASSLTLFEKHNNNKAVFSIANNNVILNGKDFTAGLETALNVSYEGVTLSMGLDNIAIALNNGNFKFSYTRTGHEHKFTYAVASTEYIDAYKPIEISAIISIVFGEDAFKKYFGLEGDAALNELDRLLTIIDENQVAANKADLERGLILVLGILGMAALYKFLPKDVIKKLGQYIAQRGELFPA